MTKLTTFANRLNARIRRTTLPSLFFLTDAARVADPGAVVACMPRGSGVILRDYAATNRADLARTLAEIAHNRDLRLLIAGDGNLAKQVGAAGLHLPESRGQEALVWRARYPNWLITVAAHSASALSAVASTGADAALLAPVFATRSHPGRPALGAAGFRAQALASPVPVIALGGLTAANVDQLITGQIVGIAAIGGLAEELAPHDHRNAPRSID